VKNNTFITIFEDTICGIDSENTTKVLTRFLY